LRHRSSECALKTQMPFNPLPDKKYCFVYISSAQQGRISEPTFHVDVIHVAENFVQLIIYSTNSSKLSINLEVIIGNSRIFSAFWFKSATSSYCDVW